MTLFLQRLAERAMGLATPVRTVSAHPYTPPSLLMKEAGFSGHQTDPSINAMPSGMRHGFSVQDGHAETVATTVVNRQFFSDSDVGADTGKDARAAAYRSGQPIPAIAAGKVSHEATSGAGLVDSEPVASNAALTSRAVSGVNAHAGAGESRRTGTGGEVPEGGLPPMTLLDSETRSQAVSQTSPESPLNGTAGNSLLRGVGKTLLPLTHDISDFLHPVVDAVPGSGKGGRDGSGGNDGLDVHVTIGRVEVTAVYDHARQTPSRIAPNRRPAPMSLDEYLAGRQGRRK